MELKEYQETALNQVSIYLRNLSEWRNKNSLVVKSVGKEVSIDFPLKAWIQSEVTRPYKSRKNGLGEDAPNFCLKIPTGGGKTLLAVKTIDLINSLYVMKRTGLVLWVVPTTQIYRQTIQNLRNRDHPYRQNLDIASGGRTMIVEKTDHFSPQDLKENLVVLMLMLPSASRKTKETLKLFQDNGGFQEFFPPEDNIELQKKLLEQIPNLDYFGKESGFWGKQIKTSMGNTLRVLSPIIIVDEGHKAYSEIALDTLYGFNPSIIVELSATPNENSNILVDIRGIELNREEMIKLDLHITNKVSPDWKDTLLASVNHRNVLEEKAKEYEALTGNYIRPICLIQAERTGKDQRDGNYIHSEDVREHLIRVVGIPSEQVIVKTSDKDELKEIDDIGGLMTKDCAVRYIITKQALQEGWDCAFAYVLTILTNPSSKNALTQLVGRILRQPYARKTKVQELDESYCFVFQQRGALILEEIRKGFGLEGLGDLASRVVTDEDLGETTEQEKTFHIREKFRDLAEETVLPVFVVKDNGSWRMIDYETDITSRLNWSKINLEPIFSLPLSISEENDIEQITTISEDVEQLIEQKTAKKLRQGGLRLDSVFLTRHIIDIIPNPWVAYEIGELILAELIKRNNIALVTNNFVFIIEELRKLLAREKDRIAQEVFHSLLRENLLRFIVIGKEFRFSFPETIKIKTTSKPLLSQDGMPLQRSLFDYVPEDELNETEKAVAWYLEDQDRLFFWYRNIPRRDYAIQGWRKQKIYPDFIFTEADSQEGIEYEKVFIAETKGLHLKNEDTDYKKSVFDICNAMVAEKKWEELKLAFKNKSIRFEVIFEDEWKRKLNSLLQN